MAALAASMFLLQATIGIGNDLADVERDLGRPDKPLATGDVPRRLAVSFGALTAVLGLGLAALVAPGAAAIGALGLGVGLLYDLRLRGTAWSWLPFAVGIPLLPVFAWLGGSGCVPPAGVLLVPLAILAGAQVAIANALADLEMDLTSGVVSVATAIGARKAVLASAALQAATIVASVASLALLGGRGPALLLVAVAIPALGVSAVLSSRPSTRARQLGWVIDCVGLALLAAGWVAAVAGGQALPVPPC